MFPDGSLTRNTVPSGRLPALCLARESGMVVSTGVVQVAPWSELSEASWRKLEVLVAEDHDQCAVAPCEPTRLQLAAFGAGVRKISHQPPGPARKARRIVGIERRGKQPRLKMERANNPPARQGVKVLLDDAWHWLAVGARHAVWRGPVQSVRTNRVLGVAALAGSNPKGQTLM